jgi:hypothetical protein
MYKELEIPINSDNKKNIEQKITKWRKFEKTNIVIEGGIRHDEILQKK